MTKYISVEDLLSFPLNFSSISSSLNAVATVTWEDIAKKFFSHLSEAGQTNVTRMLGLYTFSLFLVLYILQTAHFWANTVVV